MLHRLKILFDKSALILILPALLVLLLIAPEMALTLIEWSLFAFALAGAAIIITRLSFPQIKLTALVRDARQGNLPAAVLASTTVLFVGILILTLVMWAKA